MFLLPLLFLVSVESRGLEQFSNADPTPPNSTDWDYIVFSQQWLITDCIDWENQNPVNTCKIPKTKNQWTVHGLWPTKSGTNGPNFCDSSIKFDPTLLKPLMNDLNEQWAEIRNNTKPYSFWKHEWTKHGTCASSSPLLNSVPNYFAQGLKWNSQYNLSNLLAKNGIVPSSTQGYTIEAITKSIQEATGKVPVVQCNVEVEAGDKESLISEIRICFDKEFNLIDCTPTDGGNCSQKKLIMYLGNVPPPVTTTTTDSYDEMDYHNIDDDERYDSFQERLIKAYNSLRLLIWLTT